MVQPSLFDEERAIARPTDPATSHEAAASIDRLIARQSAVLEVFKKKIRLTHDQLIDEYAILFPDFPQSESGLRTRCSELVDKGYVRESGDFVTKPSGRRANTWEITNIGKESILTNEA